MQVMEETQWCAGIERGRDTKRYTYSTYVYVCMVLRTAHIVRHICTRLRQQYYYSNRVICSTSKIVKVSEIS